MPRMQNSQQRTIFLLSCISWVLLLFRYGYSFGHGDHAEVLPYMLHINHPELYQQDFYVGYISQLTPNIRWVFVQTFRWLNGFAGEGFFVLHGFYTLFLIAGTLQVARLCQMNIAKAWIGLMAYLCLGMGRIPGGNDWYLSNFQSENVAFVLSIWAIYFLLKHKHYPAMGLFGLATLFHPLAGLLFFTSSFFASALCGKIHVRSVFLYILTGGVYFLLIYDQQGRSVTHLSHDLYFDLLVRFRNPHHNLPSAFKISGWVLTVFFSFYLLYNHWKNSPFIRYMVLTILLGSLVYLIGVEVLNSVTVAQTQWFKLYALIWALGSAAMFNRLLPDFTLHPRLIQLITGFSLIALAIFMLFPGLNPLQKPMDILGYHQDPELIDICRQAKEKTDTNALFVIPFMADAFPYYAERSVYICFKAVPHNPDGILQWYRRIEAIYGVGISTGGGFSLQSEADEHFQRNLRSANRQNLFPKGVTHALSLRDTSISDVLFYNSKYQIVSVRPR